MNIPKTQYQIPIEQVVAQRVIYIHGNGDQSVVMRKERPKTSINNRAASAAMDGSSSNTASRTRRSVMQGKKQGNYYEIMNSIARKNIQEKYQKLLTSFKGLSEIEKLRVLSPERITHGGASKSMLNKGPAPQNIFGLPKSEDAMNEKIQQKNSRTTISSMNQTLDKTRAGSASSNSRPMRPNSAYSAMVQPHDFSAGTPANQPQHQKKSFDYGYLDQNDSGFHDQSFNMSSTSFLNQKTLNPKSYKKKSIDFNPDILEKQVKSNSINQHETNRVSIDSDAIFNFKTKTQDSTKHHSTPHEWSLDEMPKQGTLLKYFRSRKYRTKSTMASGTTHDMDSSHPGGVRAQSASQGMRKKTSEGGKSRQGMRSNAAIDDSTDDFKFSRGRPRTGEGHRPFSSIPGIRPSTGTRPSTTMNASRNEPLFGSFDHQTGGKLLDQSIEGSKKVSISQMHDTLKGAFTPHSVGGFRQREQSIKLEDLYGRANQNETLLQSLKTQNRDEEEEEERHEHPPHPSERQLDSEFEDLPSNETKKSPGKGDSRSQSPPLQQAQTPLQKSTDSERSASPGKRKQSLLASLTKVKEASKKTSPFKDIVLQGMSKLKEEKKDSQELRKSQDDAKSSDRKSQISVPEGEGQKDEDIPPSKTNETQKTESSSFDPNKQFEIRSPFMVGMALKKMVKFIRKKRQELDDVVMKNAKEQADLEQDQASKNLNYLEIVKAKGIEQHSEGFVQPFEQFKEDRGIIEKDINDIEEEISELKNEREEYIENTKLGWNNAIKVSPNTLSLDELDFINREFTRNDPTLFKAEQVDEMLTKLKFFKRIDKLVRMKFYQHSSFLSVPKGEYVFRQGDYGDQMYVILQGSVDIKINKVIYKDQVEITVTSLYDGGHFGELAMMGTNQKQFDLLDLTATSIAQMRVELNSKKNKKKKKKQLSKLEAATRQKSSLDPDEKEEEESEEEDEEASLNKDYKERQDRVASVFTTQECHLLQINRQKFKEILISVLQEDVDQKVKILQLIPFFNYEDPAQLVPLANNLGNATFKMGQRIICTGDLVEEFYIVAKGKCKVVHEMVEEQPYFEDRYKKKLKPFTFNEVSKKKKLEKLEDKENQNVHQIKKNSKTRTYDMEPYYDPEDPENEHLCLRHIPFKELFTSDYFGIRPLLNLDDDQNFTTEQKNRSKLTIIADSPVVELYTLHRKNLVYVPEKVKNILLQGLRDKKDYDAENIEEKVQEAKEWNKYRKNLMNNYFNKTKYPDLNKGKDLYKVF